MADSREQEGFDKRPNEIYDPIKDFTSMIDLLRASLLKEEFIDRMKEYKKEISDGAEATGLTSREYIEKAGVVSFRDPRR